MFLNIKNTSKKIFVCENTFIKYNSKEKKYLYRAINNKCILIDYKSYFQIKRLK